MRKLPILILHYLSIKPTMALASFNILQLLQNLLHNLGYPAVVLFVMIESSGIPFPGETMLLLASFYAAVYHDLSLPIVIACAAAGAIIGDNIGYGVGRTGGKAFIERYGRYFFLKPERLQRSEEFFARHGDKTVFFGRFVAILRAFAAFLAGVNKMAWPTFLVYNAAGGILWAIAYGLIGYYAGRIFHDNFGQVEHLAGYISWILAVIIILGAITAFIIYKKRKDNEHQATSK
ncbi:DedA family protein [Dictyobacter kobayashii]|uniref:DedA family protein n=1 Tax=Dictyobacter kobayashii TaxID=2014872 RepID=A0A402API7_9CHLR|nr:DedA family protein [Dictyobacter kobayashii]GCE21012.1 DedA family protein [Dictyobacter kobayashii]